MDENVNGDIVDEKTFLAGKTVRNQINRRSEMAQEIISARPDFTEKWALFMIMGVLLLLLAGTWFIKYPDIIEASATLTAFNAPKELITRQEGRLTELLVHNNEKVDKNQVLGWIESTASHEEVLALSGLLDSCAGLLNTGQEQSASRLFDKPFNNLGEIQQQYQSFITALQLFRDYTGDGFYLRKRVMLQNDIHALDSAHRTVQAQKTLTEQDIRLAEETYNMNQKLYNERVISSDEFRTEKSKVINKQMAIPQLEASLLSDEAQKRDKLKELDQIEHDRAQELTTFQQAVQSLKSAVDDWKKKYILQAPVAGRVVFTIPLQENQFLPQGRLLGYINPDDSHFYAEVNLPQSNFGKIDTGLQVQLRFDAYPYQEMGFVGGTLSYVSNVPSDSGFLANVRLDNGLETSSHRPIPYKSGLKAQAIIITRNMRLLQRLWFGMNKSASVGNK